MEEEREKRERGGERERERGLVLHVDLEFKDFELAISPDCGTHDA